jgi:hypothetical protein
MQFYSGPEFITLTEDLMEDEEDLQEVPSEVAAASVLKTSRFAFLRKVCQRLIPLKDHDVLVDLRWFL